MIKRITLFTVTTLLIFATGLTVFFFVREGGSLFKNQSNRYYSEYQLTGKLSDLLKSAILNPKGERGDDISTALLESQSYEVAEIFNIVAPSTDFYIKATESALFKHDLHNANKYMAKIPEGTKMDELSLFKTWITTESPEYLLETTETNAGKLMYMVSKQDFSLFILDNYLGKEITANNNTHPGKKENLLLQAQTLANNGFQKAATSILNEDDYSCNTDYYLVLSDVYVGQDNQIEALDTIDRGLQCDSMNIKLLNRAREYSTQLNRVDLVEEYEAQLQYLTEISDK
jgi:hypothetical protein